MLILVITNRTNKKQMNMKKLILILGIAMVSLTSCKKDDINPNVEAEEPIEVVDCNCGIVVMVTPISSVRNELRIRNNCSNNIKYASEIDLSVGPGDELCADNPW